jgi:hypothetical protein
MMKKFASISIVGFTAFSLLSLTIFVMIGQVRAHDSQDVASIQASKETSTEFHEETGTLSDPVGYSIAFSKTVGTDPGACATTDTITLPFGGGDVTYCFMVTNTSMVTLTHHDLSDTELGLILDDFPYSLAPGEDVFVTQAVNITVTTINTATWMATDNIGTASGTDSATVTVESPAPTIDVSPNSMASIQAPDTLITQTLTVSSARRRHDILIEIARLDEEFRQGAKTGGGEGTYRRRREALLRELESGSGDAGPRS